MSEALRVGRRPPLSFAALALTLSAPSLQAQPVVEEAVRFQYAVPGECPDLAAFTVRVRERTERGRVAIEGELARTVNVRVAPDGDGFTGSIELIDDSGSNVSRRVHGQQCDEVVSSLALITALALDASFRPEQAQPSAKVASAEPPASVAEGPEPPRTPAPAPRAPAAPPLGARVGVAGGYDAGIAGYSLGLMGQLDWPSGMALRFVAHYASADRTIDTGRRANLRLLGVETSFCPKRLPLGELRFYPCAALDLGSFRAEGIVAERLVSGGNDTIFWVALGPALRLAWEPSAPFWLELHGQLEFPLRSHEFMFRSPPKQVFEIKALRTPMAGLGIAAGVRFW